MKIADLLQTEHIDIDPLRCSGKPVLKNTRFSIAQMLMEIVATSDDKIDEVCDDLTLNKKDVIGALYDMASFYGQYWAKDEREIQCTQQ